MSSVGSVTVWISQLKEGNREAARQLWNRYCQQLIGFARKKLKNFPRRVQDEEDVVVNVLDSFFRDAAGGQLPRLDDRNNLWRLLLVMTSQKVIDLMRREQALERGGGRRPVSVEEELGEFISRAPSPDVVTEVVEEWDRLLESLGDAELRTIAVHKMEGYTNEEIAAKIGRVTRTVERRLGVIRDILSKKNEG